MAQSAPRIPAWRRLGLGLKNEVQSGVAVPATPEPHVANSQHVPQVTQADAHQSSEPAEKGTPSKLGKRKHQHDPTDDNDGQASKKSREEHVQEGASVELPIITLPTNAAEQAAPEGTPTGETAQPKGDPNYRQKKAKKPRRKNVKPEEDSKPAKKQPDFERAAQPALSPGEPKPSKKRPTLLASIETNNTTLPPLSTPQRLQRANRSSSKDDSSSPRRADRRKSVTFTPDTKKSDGHSGQDLFKKWVAELKGAPTTATEPAPQHVNFEEVEQANAIEKPEEVKEVTKADKKEKEKKTKESKEAKPSKSTEPAATAKPIPEPTKKSTTPAPANAGKGKKKDPSLYIAYLTQYHSDRANWKFNKAKQNDVVDNALNIFRIPDAHSEALLSYISGLQGAGVIQRLKTACKATLKELAEQDAANPDTDMDDAASREQAKQDALTERVAKEQARRKVEGDAESLMTHPHGDAYIRRLRRKRAEALLLALGRTAPILPEPQASGGGSMAKGLAPAQPVKRDSKKRKRRGDISSDESSSDSSSDDSSSDESSSDESADEGSKSPSEGSRGARTEGSGSDSESGSESSSADESEKSNDSDSD